MARNLTTGLQRGLRQGLRPGLGGGDLFTIAALDLNFARYKNLDPRVTFTRASSGTYVDSQGVIRTATTNLLLRSEEFDNASWTRERLLSVTANAEIAPNGYLVAERIVEDSTASNTHTIYQAVAGLPDSTTFTFSVYLKAAGRTKAVVAFMDKSATTRGMLFDLSQGTVSSFNLNGIVDTTASNIAAIGNGWYRCSVQQSSGTGAFGPRCWVQLVSGSTNSYTGDGTSGLYLWGAQLEASSAVGEYVPTTSTINSAPRFDHNPTTGESLGLLVEEQRTNLWTYSEEFDRNNTPWGIPASVTVTANQALSPDGKLTADLINGTGNDNFINQPANLVSGTTYTMSVYVKSAGLSKDTFRLGGDSTQFSSNFTATNSWQRFTYTFTATATGFRNNFLTRDSSNNPLGLYLWGAQLEAGFPTSYIPTTTATATRSADVASITGSNFGVSRTNLLLRSEEFDNAIWGPVTGTVTANAETSPANTLTADKLIAANGGPAGQLAQGVTIASGATVTGSVYAKAGGFDRLELVLLASNNTTPYGRSTFNPNTGVVTTAAFTSNGGTNASSAVQALSNGWYRFSVTVTYPAVTSAGMRLVVSNSDSSNGDGVKGVFLWGAQLETGSVATAYIPTTSAAVTVVDSPWYRQDEGTVYVDAKEYPFASGVSRAFYGLDASSAPNTDYIRQWIWSGASGSLLNSVYTSVSGPVAAEFTQLLANEQKRVATAVKVNDFARSYNGNAAVVDAAGNLPVGIDRLGVGSTNSSFFMSGTIRRLTYFPTRLPNNVLQSITQ